MKIIITGGASGLGKAITRKIALTFPEYELFITFNNSEACAIKLRNEFKNVSIMKCNFCNNNEVDAFVSEIGVIAPDVLINNSYTGSFLGKHFYKTNPYDFKMSFEQNILPLIKITNRSIQCFRKKHFGKIINISSAALTGSPPVGSSVYAANKAYLEALSRSWAIENISYNITSNCIAPSMMVTPFTASFDERIVEEVIAKHPLKQLLSIEEVADTVLFFLQASQHINGIVFLMNAGINVR